MDTAIIVIYVIAVSSYLIGTLPIAFIHVTHLVNLVCAGKILNILQNSVNAVPYPEDILKRLKMNITDPGGYRRGQ